MDEQQKSTKQEVKTAVWVRAAERLPETDGHIPVRCDGEYYLARFEGCNMGDYVIWSCFDIREDFRIDTDQNREFIEWLDEAASQFRQPASHTEQNDPFIQKHLANIKTLTELYKVKHEIETLRQKASQPAELPPDINQWIKDEAEKLYPLVPEQQEPDSTQRINFNKRLLDMKFGWTAGAEAMYNLLQGTIKK